MATILNKSWKKRNEDKGSKSPQKWLQKTNQEFKKKNKERYHETGIRAH